MPFGMGFSELLLITAIVVVVFGATKLPDSSLGDNIERWREQQWRAQRLPGRFRHQPLELWTFRDWLLVVLAVTAVATVIANAVARWGR